MTQLITCNILKCVVPCSDDSCCSKFILKGQQKNNAKISVNMKCNVLLNFVSKGVYRVYSLALSVSLLNKG